MRKAHSKHICKSHKYKAVSKSPKAVSVDAKRFHRLVVSLAVSSTAISMREMHMQIGGFMFSGFSQKSSFGCTARASLCRTRHCNAGPEPATCAPVGDNKRPSAWPPAPPQGGGEGSGGGYPPPDEA